MLCVLASFALSFPSPLFFVAFLTFYFAHIVPPFHPLIQSPEADAEIRIADFGLATVMGGRDVHRSLVGTPGYEGLID